MARPQRALLDCRLESRAARPVASHTPTKTAQAAMNFLQNNEPEYNWAVIRDGDGFAVEGNLPEGPGAQVINEVTPDAVVERAQQSQRQRIQDRDFEAGRRAGNRSAAGRS